MTETPSGDLESLLEFPCEFPVKAMGVATDGFDAVVVSIVRNHVFGFDRRVSVYPREP